MGDRKSLFFHFYIWKESGTIFKFGMQLHNQIQFWKSYRNVLFSFKILLTSAFFLQKSVKLKKSWWSYIVNNFGFTSYTTKKSTLFKSYACSVFNNFSALIKTFEILSSTRNHACERFEGQLNGLQQNQAWEILEVI